MTVLTPEEWADLQREARHTASQMSAQDQLDLAAAAVALAMISRSTLSDDYRATTLTILRDLAPSLTHALRRVLTMGDRHNTRKRTA